MLANNRARHSAGSAVSTAEPYTKASFSWKAVFARQSRLNLLECLLLGMHSVAFDQMLPVFMHHPRQKAVQTQTSLIHFSGGFGISSNRIGLLLILNGIFGMFVQFIIFPPVAKRFGVLTCMKTCTVLFPVIYIVFPFTSLIESDQKQQIIGLLLIACKCCMTVFAFPCNAILLTNSSASAGTLGTLNGVATSVAEIGRTIGPTMGGLMFNVGVEAGLIVLPWWVMAAIALAAALPVLWMEDRPTPTELAPQSQEHANAVEDCEVGASRRRQ